MAEAICEKCGQEITDIANYTEGRTSYWTGGEFGSGELIYELHPQHKACPGTPCPRCKKPMNDFNQLTQNPMGAWMHKDCNWSPEDQMKIKAAQAQARQECKAHEARSDAEWAAGLFA